MADITLINLNMLYVKFLDGSIVRQTHIPPGIVALVAALEKSGISVDFRDYQLVDKEDLFDAGTFLDFIDNPCRIIGISCMANLLPFVLHVLPAVKQKFPRSIIVLGGVGSAGVENEILKRFTEVDIIHRGEGDVSAPLLIRALLDHAPLDMVPSISYRKNGFVQHNPNTPRIHNLDSLPLPAYDRIDFNLYDGHNILGSRGCPFPCTFCSITPIWGWKAFSRSNQSILNEMQMLHSTYGVEEFLFQDEFFISSPDRITDFARLLRKTGLKIEYKAFARIDIITKEALKALAASGCIELRFGIESGSDKILQLTRKGFSTEMALEKIALAKRHIPSVDAFYIWGFPFETHDDFRETLMQMIALRGMGIRCLPSLLTYLPQTVLYNNLKEYDRLEFCPYVLPEYMVSGIENRLSVRIEIDQQYKSLFEFIKLHKTVFPGFFHIDIENNINPKLELLEEFGFYNLKQEACGAHSPSKTHSPVSHTTIPEQEIEI